MSMSVGCFREVLNLHSMFPSGRELDLNTAPCAGVPRGCMLEGLGPCLLSTPIEQVLALPGNEPGMGFGSASFCNIMHDPFS